MSAMCTRLILWTGKKHSGKTTSVTNLGETVRESGFNVAGILAPSLYSNGKLIGFDVLDIRSRARTRLATRNTDPNDIGRFNFSPDGWQLGNSALNTALTSPVDLVVIDEFGPLELEGRGWRENVDELLDLTNALILLVVRRELAEQVQQLYGNLPSQKLNATDPKSVEAVITMLRNQRQ